MFCKILLTVNLCFFTLGLTFPQVKTTQVKITNQPVKYSPDGSTNNDIIIGPEILINGLTGFYDYQTNGDCKHYLNRYSPNIMHAVFMTAFDSANTSASRRVKYAFSSDDGQTWIDLGPVPNLRGGFVSLTTTANGSAALGETYTVPGLEPGILYIDAAPGAGVFTGYGVSSGGLNGVWPNVALLSNGNILETEETYYGSAASDTGLIQVFNTTSHTFGPPVRIYNPFGISQMNMRYTCAAGPAGKGLFLMNLITDVGGNYGLNRIAAAFTTDNGVTWSTPSVVFNPIIVGSDTLSPFLGIDAIYDAAGNYYIAFNTTSRSGLFSSAKLWVQKNGGTPVLVAQHSGVNGIPQAANIPLHADAGICTIDHPSLSISADGQFIYAGYSVMFQNDTLRGYNKCHAFLSFSLLSNLSFYPPIQITPSGAGSFDERYINIAQKSPIENGYSCVYMSYQKDTQPGSCVFNDAAPISRSWLAFRKINLNDPIGIMPGANNTPSEFILEQNYPNPFNPMTKIKFALPKNSFARLVVYDMLGRELETLVNEQLNAGTYDANWDADKYSSGVYYYKLTAGGFTETKKMVLIK